MEPTRVARPFMPDYGIDADPGGLLPWSWALERLVSSREYWVATLWPDGRPHVTPVWAAWHDEAVWFSCGGRSRKARNLDADPRCVVTTSDATEPVTVEGNAVRLTAYGDAETFARLVTEKYGLSESTDFFHANALYRVAPVVVVGMVERDFTSSPTRWSF